MQSKPCSVQRVLGAAEHGKQRNGTSAGGGLGNDGNIDKRRPDLVERSTKSQSHLGGRLDRS